MIEIIGTELNQWDTGRSVRVTGTEASHVHLANQGDSKAVIMELADSLALIPNYLLQTGKQLCVYAVADGVTIESKVFYVKKRERPENYVYEDDQRNYIYELIESAEQATLEAQRVAEGLKTSWDKLYPYLDGRFKELEDKINAGGGGGGDVPSMDEIVDAVLDALPNGDEVSY